MSLRWKLRVFRCLCVFVGFGFVRAACVGCLKGKTGRKPQVVLGFDPPNLSGTQMGLRQVVCASRWADIPGVGGKRTRLHRLGGRIILGPLKRGWGCAAEMARDSGTLQLPCQIRLSDTLPRIREVEFWAFPEKEVVVFR